MLNLAVSWIVYQIEMLIAYIVFSYVSIRKHSVLSTFFAGLIIFSSGAIINYAFSNTVWVNTVYTMVMNFSFALLCFEFRVRAAAIYSFLMDLFSIAFECMTVFSISAIIGSSITEYNSNMAILIIEAATSKTLYLLSCVFILDFSKSSGCVDKIPASFYFFPVCILLSLLSLWYICINEQLKEINQLLLSVISVVLLGSTVFLFITYRHNIEKDNEYIRVKSEFDRLQTEKAYYDILEHQNQQLMIYAHDAKNHLAAIKSLSSNPEINSYTEKLLNQLGSYTKSCHSGNMILDVIINKYVTECEMCQIKFDYDIKSCNLAKVEDIDLVSVLGNLLDNAVAAAGKSTEKYVSLETTTRNSYDVVVISNSCDFAPEQKGAQLVTTKEDKKLHGFGIKSVKKTLKKYQGDFNWDYDIERQLFITTVMIGSIV
jgi:hypothetical protein